MEWESLRCVLQMSRIAVLIGLVYRSLISPSTWLIAFLFHHFSVTWSTKETDTDLSNFQAFTSFTKSTNPQVHGFAYPRIHESTSPRIHESMNPRSTNPQIHESTNPRIHESTNPQIHESTNPRIHEPTNPRIHESTSQSSYLGVPLTPHCMLPTAFCTLYQGTRLALWCFASVKCFVIWLTFS